MSLFFFYPFLPLFSIVFLAFSFCFSPYLFLFNLSALLTHSLSLSLSCSVSSSPLSLSSNSCAFLLFYLSRHIFISMPTVPSILVLFVVDIFFLRRSTNCACSTYLRGWCTVIVVARTVVKHITSTECRTLKS